MSEYQSNSLESLTASSEADIAFHLSDLPSSRVVREQQAVARVFDAAAETAPAPLEHWEEGARIYVDDVSALIEHFRREELTKADVGLTGPEA